MSSASLTVVTVDWRTEGGIGMMDWVPMGVVGQLFSAVGLSSEQGTYRGT